MDPLMVRVFKRPFLLLVGKVWSLGMTKSFEVVQTRSAWSTPPFNLCGNVLLFYSPR